MLGAGAGFRGTVLVYIEVAGGEEEGVADAVERDAAEDERGRPDGEGDIAGSLCKDKIAMSNPLAGRSVEFQAGLRGVPDLSTLKCVQRRKDVNPEMDVSRKAHNESLVRKPTGFASSLRWVIMK